MQPLETFPGLSDVMDTGSNTVQLFVLEWCSDLWRWKSFDAFQTAAAVGIGLLSEGESSFWKVANNVCYV